MQRIEGRLSMTVMTGIPLQTGFIMSMTGIIITMTVTIIVILAITTSHTVNGLIILATGKRRQRESNQVIGIIIMNWTFWYCALHYIRFDLLVLFNNFQFGVAEPHRRKLVVISVRVDVLGDLVSQIRMRMGDLQ